MAVCNVLVIKSRSPSVIAVERMPFRMLAENERICGYANFRLFLIRRDFDAKHL